ncbi:hypothetical protein P153DRAFT_289769 [Dothidotthia symphoricarpi CBS 119687]|uniref:Uncharacterized protein n=1 Tax=Dothidotthia symphoricarpi CBS 119687 TaxID=1392245 RepID=A0A6A6ADY7_9PLEO|nr:uncharacterized protein P153DRAFT_289769 [Dothidotthia symphoricarpi CBS 119687]KAF2129776.1 hypothetical protein P153DRAFT_289769 [Dothidotthia symphoricarpi CBS 119687]
MESVLGWFFGQSKPIESEPFTTPTYQDVRTVRALLKTLQLPTELVLSILDLAQYWPTHEFKTTPNARITAAARGGQSASATLCLNASIFNNPTVDDLQSRDEKPKIKSIEFDLVSRDQGWTSENTTGSYSTSSWVEVSILRNVSGDARGFSFPDNQRSSPQDYQNTISDQGWSFVKRPETALQGPQDDEGDFAWYLQGNRVAAGRADYRVVWSVDGNQGDEGAGTGERFLDELKEGDAILVWARAKWPGWQCIVESAKITVRYGF